jgi:hypothetical protein
VLASLSRRCSRVSGIWRRDRLSRAGNAANTTEYICVTERCEPRHSSRTTFSIVCRQEPSAYFIEKPPPVFCCRSSLVTYRQLGHSYATSPGSVPTGAMLTTSCIAAPHLGQSRASARLPRLRFDTTPRPNHFGTPRGRNQIRPRRGQRPASYAVSPIH